MRTGHKSARWAALTTALSSERLKCTISSLKLRSSSSLCRFSLRTDAHISTWATALSRREEQHSQAQWKATHAVVHAEAPILQGSPHKTILRSQERNTWLEELEPIPNPGLRSNDTRVVITKVLGDYVSREILPLPNTFLH